MATKKTKKAKPSRPLKDIIGRVYGARLYGATVGHDEARDLIYSHGFRMSGMTDDTADVWADRMAYDSWKGQR